MVSSPETIVSRRRGDVESIRIYADSDVYALLADVEEEINRMGDEAESNKIREEQEELVISAGITLNATVFTGVPNTRY